MNKPRIRVYTKSYDLIMAENRILNFKPKSITLDFYFYVNNKNTTNPNYSQVNYFYDLRQ